MLSARAYKNSIAYLWLLEIHSKGFIQGEVIIANHLINHDEDSIERLQTSILRNSESSHNTLIKERIYSLLWMALSW